jgi:pyruvate/2-oxoacid:ferredoxin oxidoreductase alpha subunit
MFENCVAAAGMRLPVVMVVANRTLGPPWNIWADHGDALALRDHGLIQFYCADNQEVFDTVLCAFRLAEDARVMMPAMVCMEGFIVSHTVAPTEIPRQEQVDAFLPSTTVPHRLGEVPHALGQLEAPHQTEVHRRQHHRAMLDVPRVYAEIQNEFERVFGRRLADAIEAYRAEDADTLIISMGTLGATAERVVDTLRQAGRRVGALRVRLFRPLPAEAIRAVMAGKQRVMVLDRDVSLGFGGVLWGEVRALADPGAVVQNYIAGLGGGDVLPEHVAAWLDDLCGREAAGAPVMTDVV